MHMGESGLETNLYEFQGVKVEERVIPNEIGLIKAEL